MVELFFIDSRPKPDLSIRERELHDAHVRSHAAAVSHRAKRVRNLNLKDSKNSSRAKQVLEFTSTSLEDSDRRSLSPNQHSVALSSARRKSESSPTLATLSYLIPGRQYQEDDSDDQYTVEIGDQFFQSYLTREELLTESIGSPDSFGAVPWWASESTDYFTYTMVPFHYTVHRIFNVTMIMPDFFSSTLQHHAWCHAGMAYVDSILGHARRPGQQPSSSVLKKSNLAISGLREHLASSKGPPDDATILGVTSVSIVTRLTGDPNMLEMHNKMLKMLVQSRGGINAFDSNSLTRTFLLQWESAWNPQTGTEKDSLFPEARPPLGLLYQPDSFLRQSLVARIPVGFRRVETWLSISSLEILARAAQVAASGNLADLPDTGQCHRDFWEACPCLRPSDNPGEAVVFERLIMRALMLYCFRMFNITQAPSLTLMNAQRCLSASLECRSISDDDDDDDVQTSLIWCWMCLLYSWSQPQHDMGAQEKLWLPKMRRAFPIPHRTDQILAKLRLFFSQEKFERRCWVYWNTLLEGEDVNVI